MRRYRFVCFVTLLSLATMFNALPACGAAEVSPAPLPTQITSDRMQYDAAGQKVVFTGKVHVIRPDFQLWSDRLTVLLEKAPKKKGQEESNDTASPAMGLEAGQVERIIAERNVRMQQNDKTGSCGKATYVASDGKIIMEQNPVVNDGPNQIRGQIINYYTRDNRSEVIGGVDVKFVTSGKGDSGMSLSGKPKSDTPPDTRKKNPKNGSNGQ